MEDSVVGNQEPLIAPKHITEFAPEEYHTYVKSMYKERVLSGKPKSPAPGLALSRTKKGALSLRFSKKARAFEYILEEEISKMLKHYKNLEVSEAELREVLKKRKFLVTKTRLEAEKQYEANLV